MANLESIFLQQRCRGTHSFPLAIKDNGFWWPNESYSSVKCLRGGINFNKILIQTLGYGDRTRECFPDKPQTRSICLPLFFTVLGRIIARFFGGQVVGDWIGEHILTLRPSSDRCYLKVEGKRSGDTSSSRASLSERMGTRRLLQRLLMKPWEWAGRLIYILMTRENKTTLIRRPILVLQRTRRWRARIHAAGLVCRIATGETDKRKIGKAFGRSRSEEYQPMAT